MHRKTSGFDNRYGVANPLGPAVVHSENRCVSVGLAFLALPISNDLKLQSAVLAGVFPDIAAANLANAQSVVLALVPLPLGCSCLFLR